MPKPITASRIFFIVCITALFAYPPQPAADFSDWQCNYPAKPGCPVCEDDLEPVEKIALPMDISGTYTQCIHGGGTSADPQFGTTRTHVAALFATLGPDRAKQFLQDLLDNDVRIVAGNAMVKNLVAQAHPEASPVYLGLTDTDDVLSGQADGQPVAMIYPDQDAFGTLVIPTTVCMLRGAPHPESGRALVDYLTSQEVETALATGRAGFLPIRSKLPAGRISVTRA